MMMLEVMFILEQGERVRPNYASLLPVGVWWPSCSVSDSEAGQRL